MNGRRIALCAMFIALSFIGANVKILGSIAFDSMPAFLGTLMLGPAPGALIAAVGHMLTSLLSGFPLGLPVHIIIAAVMAVTMALFFVTYVGVNKKFGFIPGAVAAGIVGVLVNGPVAVLALSPLLTPVFGSLQGVLTLVPPLSIASAANIVLAFVVYKMLKALNISVTGGN